MESKKISINEIKKNVKYEGYLWLSDSKEPVVMDGQEESGDVLKEKNIDDILTDGINPFVVEGYLYDNVSRESCSIRYVDGKAAVHKFIINDNDIKNNETKEYYSNRMDGRVLEFLDVWSPTADPLCLGMEVLQPQAKVFIGFKQ